MLRSMIAQVDLMFPPAPIAIANLAVLLPISDTPRIGRTFGTMLIALGSRSKSVTPAYFTSVLFMFIAAVAGLAPMNLVFSGFLSTAVWLVLGGLVIGIGV